MALLFWVGSFWSEAPRPAQGASAAPTSVAPAATSGRLFMVAIAAVALAAVWRPLFTAVEAKPSSIAPTLAAIDGAGGFARTDGAPSSWQPAYAGHAATSQQTFAKDGASAAVYVAFYRNPAKGRELVTSGNHLVAPENFNWKEVDRREATLAFAGRPVEATRIEVSGARERLVAWRIFWIDGRVTGSEYVAKALIAWSKMRGRGGDAALVVVHASDAGRDDVARAALEALSPRIAAMLDATGGRR
jgi:EpsI family protein